uniref:P-type ATPase, putative n=1 Tax=Toxoplasma gondii (strain ATCC 50861 / VEG) TaxID=432359 RepID=A0A0F7VEC5_TOXGV|nr:TPA: P-type ATPase, putative [Toxoplasma gondii VEG]
MGLWQDICPFCVWGIEWLWSVLPSRAKAVAFVPRCLPCLRPCFKASAKKGRREEETAQKHVGTLCVRTHTPSSSQPESPGNSHFHLAKWTNVIRTTQYTWWNFLPKNFWAQISQPANFYFLVMAFMQMVPQISDSDGLPTFLFPLSLVMVITAAKDAYENVKRTRADQEENNRLCRVVNASGEVELVPWKNLRPGNIVKLQCDEAVPADILLLNCSDEYGVAYVETVQLDGETNLKHKMCIPEIAGMVRKDHDASTLSLEISYEPPSAELYKFSGVVTLNPASPVHGRQSVLSWGRASFSHLHTGSHRLSPRAGTPQSATPGGSSVGTVRANSLNPDWRERGPEELESEKREKKGNGAGKGGLLWPGRSVNESLPRLLSKQSSRSDARGKDTQRVAVSPSVLAVPGAEAARDFLPKKFSIDISQFLWRGSTVRNTAWAYGVVLYTGQHTRIMKNTRTRELKYSRLQVYYNQHALLLAIAQFLLCLIAAVAFASHNQNMSDHAWYLESSWESGVGNFFASLGVAFGQYVLLLSYFVPITLLVQLEVCRACQAGFLSVDDRMFCPATEQKACAQSVALMEELGSITHVFSDKTGTLTQNLMQFRCLAIGDTLHGFDEYQEMAADILMVMALCHSVLPKQDLQAAGGANPLDGEHMPIDDGRGDRTRRSSSVSRIVGESEGKRPLPGDPKTALGSSTRDSCLRLPSRGPSGRAEKGVVARGGAGGLSTQNASGANSQGPMRSLGEAGEADRTNADTRMLRSASLASGTDEQEEGSTYKPLSASARVAAAPPTSVWGQRQDLQVGWTEQNAQKVSRTPGEEEQARHYFTGAARMKRVRGDASAGMFLSLPLASPLPSHAGSAQPSLRESSGRGKGSHSTSEIQDNSEFEGQRRECGLLASQASSLFSPNSSVYSSSDEETREGRNSSCEHCSNCLEPLELDSDEEGQPLSEALPSSLDHTLRLCDVASWPPSSSPSFASTSSMCPLEAENKSNNNGELAVHQRGANSPFSCPLSFGSNAPSPAVLARRDRESEEDGGQQERDCTATLGFQESRAKYIREETRHEAAVDNQGAGFNDSIKGERGETSSLVPGLLGKAMPGPREGAERREERPTGVFALQLAEVKLTKEAEYDASSPDELALTAAAKHLGAEFLCRPSLSTIQLCLTSPFAEECLLSRADKAHLARLREKLAEERNGANCARDDPAPVSANRQHTPQDETEVAAENEGVSLVPLVVFDVLEVLEFDNFRKRMSVVIRDRDGRLRLLVKGADSSMLDIAAPGQDVMKQELKAQLAEMASQGLRTLVMGQRYLSEQQFDRYRALLIEAKAMSGDRKEDALNAALSEIEKDIELLGASGIDDKLQDQVAETISDIKQAGVKLWVLTGDKMETAIAIGHSCSILTDATYNAIVDGTSEEMVKEQLHQYMSYIVAAQLASEAFEQIALKSMVDSVASDISDVSSSVIRRGASHGRDSEKLAAQNRGAQQKKGIRGRTAGQCIHCLAGAVKQKARCVGRRAYEDSEADSVRARRARHAPPSMPWEEFVKILTFNANRKVVKADPKQRKNKRLSPAQVEDIVQEYLEHFDKSSEENQRERSKRAKFVPGRTSRPMSGAISSLQNATFSSGSTRFGVRRQGTKVHEREKGRQRSSESDARASESQAKTDAENGGEKLGRRDSTHSAQTVPGLPAKESERKARAENDADTRDEAELAKTTSRESELLSSCGVSPQESSSRGWVDLDTSRSDKYAADDDSHSAKYPLGSAGTMKSAMHEAAVEGYEACAITITGEALTHALSTAENRRYFFGLANLCSTVIACRVSPKQKSDVVTQCKRYQSGTVSLGIGDGANDVGMLVAANVGVGIRGKEGLQAVRAADFAIGEFKFVRNLMFYHGREALRRNAFQMYQTIFKNVVFGLADLFFAFVSVFAASDIFNPWLKQLYNVLYTCIPVMLFTVFDRQLPYDVLLQTPVLYPAFSKLGVNMFAGARAFWKWFLFGFYVSATLVYFPLYGIGWAFTYTNNDGIITFSLAFYGAIVFWCIILVCNLVMVPFMHTWFWFIWLGIFLDFGFWWMSLAICPRISDTFCTDLAGSVEALHQDPRYYFACIIAVFVALFPQYLIWFFKVAFRPSAPCVIRERIAKGVFDVVIAPRGGQKMAVVVPKKVSNEWRGFAFAEQDHTRWGQHRRSMRAVLDGLPAQAFPSGSEVNPSLWNRPFASVLPENNAESSVLPTRNVVENRDGAAGSCGPFEQGSLARRFSRLGMRTQQISACPGVESENDEGRQPGEEEQLNLQTSASSGESLPGASAPRNAANDA